MSELPGLPELAEPPPARAYELPGPRRVVAAGLQLAIASARDLRQGSIYIGLLALAAFGPAIVYLVAAIDRFDLDLAAALEDLAFGGGQYFFEHPELVGPLLFLEALAVVGVVLLFAISIDAQVIAVAVLAGHAATNPIRLPEAVTRARQVFWRMVGGGLLVGTYSTVVQLVLGLVLGAADGSNPAIDFVIALIATIATVPFAYLATGIVLGDVGTLEALRRSTRLFQARPVIALVVVLFTLVTSAIEAFALGAGFDLIGRVGELLGLDATAGGAALILPIVLALAAVAAFGSLLFTIAALVAAPQVGAFLGLTFFAGGLERARTEGGRAIGFRWVTRPMQVAFIGLGAAALLGIGQLA